MEKRLALALVLCLLWIILSQKFFMPQSKPGGTQAPVQAQEQEAEGDRTSEAGGEPPSIEEDLDVGKEALDAEEGSDHFDRTEATEETPFFVETDVYQARFLNRGAALASLKFKQYFVDPDVLHDDAAKADPANWLEILQEVRRDTPSFLLREMSQARYDLDRVCWEQEVVRRDTGGTDVVFTYRTGDGLVFRKIFSFHPGAYHIDLSLEVGNRNPELKRSINLVLDGPSGIYDRNRASFTMGPQGVIYATGEDPSNLQPELFKRTPDKLKDAAFSWAARGPAHLFFSGVTSNYFALLVKPIEGPMLRKTSLYALEDSNKVDKAEEDYRLQHGTEPPPDRINEFIEAARVNVRSDLQLGLKAPLPGETVTQQFLFFAGPKSTDLLDRPSYHDFYILIEDSYGSMAWINISLIWILKFFHSLFANWGVAIICLTLVVKILLFPLSRVQQVSMHSYSEKMKKLKPKLEELKKKFKNNKKKFNEAQMTLMKEEGVRPPLMGCLLIFLQFPIFIGLFQILRTAYELRHSPFCLWVKDLSQPDALPLPFSLPVLGNSINVLPILMTVAFYYQQKMMPKPESADPQAQQMQKIMRFMPIIFGVMFYSYASGLSLYWMTSNLLSIIEYKFIRKKFPIGVPVNGAKAKTA